MDTKEVLSLKDSHKKNMKFLSVVLPLSLTLWFVLMVFGEILNPNSFENLPQNERNAHITSLIFRSDSWHFPITITKKIGEGIPLSLTNTIPLFALIFKFFNSSLQYFGLWIVFSFLLVTYFGYRISYLMTSNRLIASLGSLLFISIPFLWNQTLSNFYMAAQWLIIWAYYIFFQKKSYMSHEWYLVIGISCFIHPFFTFVSFFIMISDLFHLYIYKHFISVIKAVSSLGLHLTYTIFYLSIAGFFYLPFLYDPIESIPTLYFQQIYLSLGIGLLLSAIIIIILGVIFSKKSKKYLKYYKPLISTLLFFLLLTFFGNICVIMRNFIQNSWTKEHIFGIFTSGSKFLFPILWIIPIIVIHSSGVLEKRKKSVGVILLGVLVIVQLQYVLNLKNIIRTTRKQLPYHIQEFIGDKKELIWLFTNNNIPTTPPAYEEFAYYAYLKDLKINSANLIRFPTGYRKNIEKQRNDFWLKKFQTNSIYILDSSFLEKEIAILGDTISYQELILFRPY
ncbi:MAG: DUF6311 domain-containing protein [Brevinema sp.]